MMLQVMIFHEHAVKAQNSGIRPYSRNPYYWQYKGKPVLLLGASNGDNLFQSKDLETQLDLLVSVGGNYLRNVMNSCDEGDLQPFGQASNGKYDLNSWNDPYWQLFENMLKLSNEKNVIVQIEIWDRFEHSRNFWQSDPYNPANNINYTFEESRFVKDYPEHPGFNKQPFFYSVPALNNNRVVLKYQEAFLKKLLSISLKYNNVLYCIDNESSGAEEWAIYWAKFLRENSSGKYICITQMWGDGNVTRPMHMRTLDHPEIYDFIDISQNSHIKGTSNWENARYVFDYIKDAPRPVNSAKIYGGNENRFGDAKHAENTFCRNVLNGFASSRFHRPPVGLGLSDVSMNCIRTIRNIENRVKFWEISPKMDLLIHAGKTEVYISAGTGEKYLLYFPNGGSVKLDLTNHNRKFRLRWIYSSDAEWIKSSTIKGGDIVELKSDRNASCFALLEK